MDQMQDYEVNDIIENLPYLERNNWERSRFEAYVHCQTQTKKHIKPADLLKFPWENEREKGDVEISNYDIQRLRSKAEQMKNIKWQENT